MRVLAIDAGARRVGLAISDRSRTLARPLTTVAVTSVADAIDRVARIVDELAVEEDGLETIVVGLPARLDGSPTDSTADVRSFIDGLTARTSNVHAGAPSPRFTIVTADERLTTREAESRLAVRERDWKKRKKQLDAVAAAIILQDYLDQL
ncbi:MAG TPA: Holliday junction resolvase RuvX [Vicinamibacterales bacterium]|nr:Holliday junction resolvase RuvX [Vicinamibacterales bacterium]